MTNSSDHDLLLKIHDRVFECPTKDDLRGCMSDHVRDLHKADESSIVIKPGKSNKAAIAISGVISAVVMALLAKLGLGL
jgi:hypothetical protein